MINTNNEDIFVSWGFPPFFSSSNHLTAERHIFSLEMLLKTFSDCDFWAATAPTSVLGDESKENPDKEVIFLVLIKFNKIFLVHSTKGYGLYHLSGNSECCNLNTFSMSV